MPGPEGGPWGPPHLSWIWRYQKLKNHVPTNVGINSNSFDSFLEKKFLGSSKKMAKLKDMLKNQKTWAKIPNFLIFWAISTCYTSKESIFHTKFNFKEKNYDLFEVKLKKSNFWFFCQNLCRHCVFNRKFFKFVQRNSKIWVALCFWKVLKSKVIKGKLMISNHLEMADKCLPRGGPGAPSRPFWVKLN